MKNKKGIGLPNVLSIVLAIAGILLISYAAYQLYNFFGSEKDANAQEFLEGLIGKIDNLEDEETGTFAMRWIEGYRVMGYDKSLPREEVPEKCFFESCICICKAKGDLSGNWKKEQKNECQEMGFCRDLGNKEINLLIKNQWRYFGNDCRWKDSGKIVVSPGKKDILHHEGTDKGNLFELEISKEGEVLTFAKITYKDVGENRILAKLIKQIVAGADNVEINEETNECYFIRK